MSWLTVVLLVLGCFSQLSLGDGSPMIPGGASPVVVVGDANSSEGNEDDIAGLKTALSSGIKPQYIQKTGYNPPNFNLSSYTKQIVAGINYFAKIQLCEHDFAHLWIFVPLQFPAESMQLMSIENGKQLGDPIDMSELRDSAANSDGNASMTIAASNNSNSNTPPLLGGMGGVTRVDDGGLGAGSDSASALKNLLATTIKDQFTKEVGFQPCTFDLVSFASQVVSGTNYFAKVRIGSAEYVHLRIYQPLFGPALLHGILRDKTADDPLTYFSQNIAVPSPPPTQQLGRGSPLRLGGLGSVVMVSRNGSNSDTTIKLQEALNSTVRDQFAQQSGAQPSTFDLISYASQVVAGINYFAKVKVNDSEYAHLRIYQPTGQPMRLTAFQRGKSFGDSLDYFDSAPIWEHQQIRIPPTYTMAGLVGATPPQISGGLSQVILVGPLLAEIGDLQAALSTYIRDQFIQQQNFTPTNFTLISYASQTVAGKNFFVKVQLSDLEYAHLRIFRPLPFVNQKMRLMSVQRGKTLGDPITYVDVNLGGTRPIVGTDMAQNPMMLGGVPPPPGSRQAPFFPRTGGLGRTTFIGDPKSSVDNAKEIADLQAALSSYILDDFIQKANYTPSNFTLIAYASQVVAGTNYFAKVQVNPSECVHLRIYKPLPFTGLNMSLIAFQLGKSLSDNIDYFESKPAGPPTTGLDLNIPPRPLFLPGGFGPTVVVGDQVTSNGREDEIATLQAVLDGDLKTQFVNQTNFQPANLTLVAFRSQVVAGMNYLCKVYLGNAEYAFLTIYKPLPYTGLPMSLTNIRRGKKAADSIDDF